MACGAGKAANWRPAAMGSGGGCCRCLAYRRRGAGNIRPRAPRLFTPLRRLSCLWQDDNAAAETALMKGDEKLMKLENNGDSGVGENNGGNSQLKACGLRAWRSSLCIISALLLHGTHNHLFRHS